MKNLQVIDGALNCVYDVFAASEDEFNLIFQPGEDIAFIDEVHTRLSQEAFARIFPSIWRRRIPKSEVCGIHGTLFYDLEDKKAFYPTRRDEEARNPDGSRLR